MRELYGNNLQTTLNGAINNSTTSVVITSATGWPTLGFRVIVDSEIMYCTSRSGTTLTVVRGTEGTTAASHIDLSAIRSILTAAMLDNYRAEILAMCGLVPNETSLSADDDNFDDESFSSWTTVQGTPNCTVTEKFHRASILIPGSSGNGQLYSFMKAKAPSTGNWVQAGFQMAGSGGQFPIPGVLIADGATYNSGKQVHLGWSPHESKFFLRDFTNYISTNAGTGFGDVVHNYPFSTMHLRLEWRGSNQYSGYCSPDGITWATIFTNTSCNSLGTPTHMGFSTTSWGATRQNAHSFTYCKFNF